MCCPMGTVRMVKCPQDAIKITIITRSRRQLVYSGPLPRTSLQHNFPYVTQMTINRQWILRFYRTCEPLDCYDFWYAKNIRLIYAVFVVANQWPRATNKLTALYCRFYRKWKLSFWCVIIHHEGIMRGFWIRCEKLAVLTSFTWIATFMFSAVNDIFVNIGFNNDVL